jgi:hypothetical protein
MKNACPPGTFLLKNTRYAPRLEPNSIRISRIMRTVYMPFHRLLDEDEGGADGVGGEGVIGGAGEDAAKDGVGEEGIIPVPL